jgi:MoaA/NifB/PqqE/SkfB family radical SAM enzyme
MGYNLNIREETFGATLFNLKNGKREYLTKDELKDILEKNIFPNDSIVKELSEALNIKYTPLNNQKMPYKMFSFADIAFIEVTRACNLKCTHCLNNSGNIISNQLSTNELVNLIQDFSKSGIQEIRFTGGEPLVFPDIYKLITLASENGIYTSIGTNGNLINETVAKKLKDAGLKKAVVSIDGTKEQNDLIRGSGSYEKAIAALNYLKQEGIAVRVNSVILRSNIEDVIAFAKELHKNKIQLFIRRFIESGRGANLINNTLSKSDYEYVREKLFFELENGSYINGHYLRMIKDEEHKARITLPFEIEEGCRAGERAIIIIPNGDIHLCGFLAAQGFPNVGNVRNIENWSKFWSELQKKDKLSSLRSTLKRYNEIPNIQPTNCLAYAQRLINEQNKSNKEEYKKC